MKKTLIRYGSIVLILIIAYGSGIIFNQNATSDFETDIMSSEETVLVDVTRVIESRTDANGMTSLSVEIYVADAPSQSQYVVLQEQLTPLSAEALLPINAGDSMIAARTQINGNYQYNLITHQRSTSIMLVLVFFFIILILISRKNGLKTLISLGTTAWVVFMFFIPGLLAHIDTNLLVLSSCFMIASTTFLALDGFSKKALSALLGTMSGVVIAIVFTLILSRFMNIRGAINDEYSYIFLASLENPIALNDLLFASVIIGSLGAVMDVAMSIASALQEITTHNAWIAKKALFKSGMNIGNDAILTMITTLILAYLSASLPNILLLNIYHRSADYILNSNWFAAEIMQSIVGALGILLAIPFVILFFILLTNKNRDASGAAYE